MHPHSATQLHIDVAVILEQHVQVVGHDKLVPHPAPVNGVATIVVHGGCAGRLGIATLAHLGALLGQAHALGALVHHVLLHSSQLAHLQAGGLGCSAASSAGAVLLHHWQARIDEGIHSSRRLGHVNLTALKADDNVRMGLAALLELNDVHHIARRPRAPVLVLEECALAQVIEQRLQLEAKHPVDHVCPVLPGLPRQQRSTDFLPLGVAGEGDEEAAIAIDIGHCAGVINEGLLVPVAGVGMKEEGGT